MFHNDILDISGYKFNIKFDFWKVFHPECQNYIFNKINFTQNTASWTQPMRTRNLKQAQLHKTREVTHDWSNRKYHLLSC